MEWADFSYADTNLGNLNVNLLVIEWVCSKMGGTFWIISGASHKWFDELSRLTEWFLHDDILPCILDICCVSTAVVLVKNDVLMF